MRVKLGLTLTIILLCTFAAGAETTQPGLFFTISNACSAPVSFAVGDEVCLLKIDSAVYATPAFQGILAAGGQKAAMACTGKDGNGSVMFVLSPSTGGSAVVVTVKPDQVVSVPKTFCPPASASPERELLRKR